MTDGTSYDRRPEGRWSGDFGDAGILLTDTPTNFRPLRPQIDAAMIRKELLPFAPRKGGDVRATLVVALTQGCPYNHKNGKS